MKRWEIQNCTQAVPHSCGCNEKIYLIETSNLEEGREYFKFDFYRYWV